LLDRSIFSAAAGSESFIAMNSISDIPMSADNFDVEETGRMSEPPSVASGIISSSASVSISTSVFSDEWVDSVSGAVMVFSGSGLLVGISSFS
jgi:hypothetical protein